MGEMLLNGRLYGASGIRELTQAQYDALPASKLTDGILYCIKDTGIVEGEKFAPVIYSLEEREIGVWTDGKPLYQKTVHINSLPSTPDTGVVYSHNIANIDNVIDYHAVGRWSNGTIATFDHLGYPFNAFNSSFTCVADKTNITICVGVNRSSMSADVTIRYTKTTDIPGSGSWGTDGVPMVHCDGNEKIIGTWFGETLYEKSFEFTSFVSGDNVFAHNISNLKEVVNVTGTVTRTNNTVNYVLYHNPDVNSRDKINIGNILTNSIQIAIGSNFSNFLSDMKIHVTLQYTKTS